MGARRRAVVRALRSRAHERRGNSVKVLAALVTAVTVISIPGYWHLPLLLRDALMLAAVVLTVVAVSAARRKPVHRKEENDQ
jgi:hypothetical protein